MATIGSAHVSFPTRIIRCFPIRSLSGRSNEVSHCSKEKVRREYEFGRRREKEKKKERKIKRHLHSPFADLFPTNSVGSQRCSCNKKNKRELIPRETSKLEFERASLSSFSLSLSLSLKKKKRKNSTGSLLIRKVSTNTGGKGN